MTQVDFYFNALNTLSVIQRLIVKALNTHSDARVVITGTLASLQELDTYLWTFDTTSFIPHLLCSDTDIDNTLLANTPVLLMPNTDNTSSETTHLFNSLPPHCDYLIINIGLTVPSYFARFKRLIEIIGVDETSKTKGRERFLFYKQRGYPMSHLDLINTQ
ncbi:MAG: polymerase (chi subunit) protein [Pseudomonadota bacterium]|jgi:DNA polymerase-3 subunit chi